MPHRKATPVTPSRATPVVSVAPSVRHPRAGRGHPGVWHGLTCWPWEAAWNADRRAPSRFARNGPQRESLAGTLRPQFRHCQQVGSHTAGPRPSSADRGAVAELSWRSSAAPTAGIEGPESKSHPGGMPSSRILRRKTTARRQRDPACAKMRRPAPRRGAWDAWAMITGGFAAFNHRQVSGNPPGSAKTPAGLERQQPKVPVLLYSFPALPQETDSRAEAQGRGGIPRRPCASARDRFFYRPSREANEGQRNVGQRNGDKGIRNGGGQPAPVLFPCPTLLCPSSAHLAVGCPN
jgi:hypothetical protein